MTSVVDGTINKSVEPSLGPLPDTQRGFFVNPEAAPAVDGGDARANAQAVLDKKLLQDATLTQPAAVSSLIDPDFFKVARETTNTVLNGLEENNPLCLSTLARLYDRDQLDMSGYLSDLRLVTTNLDRYTLSGPDDLVIKSSTNEMIVSRKGVAYLTPGVLTASDALSGAILQFNNPDAFKNGVTLSGNLQDRYMMTLAAQKIGLKVSNPVNPLEHAADSHLLSLVKNEFDTLMAAPIAAAKNKGLSNTGPHADNNAPQIPEAPLPAVASAPVPEVTKPSIAEAQNEPVFSKKTDTAPFVDQPHDTIDVIRETIKPGPAPSVSPADIPVLEYVIDIDSPQAVSDIPPQPAPVQNNTTIIVLAQQERLSELLSRDDDALIIDNDPVPAVEVTEIAELDLDKKWAEALGLPAPAASQTTEPVTAEQVAFTEAAAPNTERRPGVTKYPLLKWTPDGPITLCP